MEGGVWRVSQRVVGILVMSGITLTDHIAPSDYIGPRLWSDGYIPTSLEEDCQIHVRHIVLPDIRADRHLLIVKVSRIETAEEDVQFIYGVSHRPEPIMAALREFEKFDGGRSIYLRCGSFLCTREAARYYEQLSLDWWEFYGPPEPFLRRMQMALFNFFAELGALFGRAQSGK